MGISYTLDGVTYYPRFDGTVRFNLAERVANVSSNITINTLNSNLASGEYKLLIESFGSHDGIYYGLESNDSVIVPFKVTNTLYGLKLTIDDNQAVINKKTGFTENKNNTIVANLEYSSGLENPNIRVSLKRRNYDSVYNTVFTLVDFKDYFSNAYDSTNLSKVYLVTNNPRSSISYYLYLKDNLKSGTYKLIFALYDNNTYIGETYKYLVIK